MQVNILFSKGIDCTIVDARFAKPLDEKLIMEIASNHEVLIDHRRRILLEDLVFM